MTTQVIFNLDSALKNKAMKKAQAEGITLTSVLKLATKAYVDGFLDIGLVGTEKLNAETRKILIQSLKESKKGKGVSEGFTDADSAIAYLNKGKE